MFIFILKKAASCYINVEQTHKVVNLAALLSIKQYVTIQTYSSAMKASLMSNNTCVEVLSFWQVVSISATWISIVLGLKLRADNQHVLGLQLRGDMQHVLGLQLSGGMQHVFGLQLRGDMQHVLAVNILNEII